MNGEAHKLLNQLLAGDLDEAGFQRLEELMNGSQEVRQLYFQYLDLDTGLRKIHLGHSAEKAVIEFNQTLDQKSPPVSRYNPWLILISLTAACFVGMALVSKFFPFTPTPNGTTTESPVELVGIVLRSPENGVLKYGQRIVTGPVEIQDGTLLLQLENGALLNLEGPAKLNLQSLGRAILHEGKVTVRCPSTAIGFVLEGPGFSAVDLGTEFGMSVKGGDAQLHVFEGEVQWRSKSKGVELLEAGEGLQTTQRTESVIMISAEADEFNRDFSKAEPVRESGRVLAYEGFEYDTPFLHLGNGGEGWGGNWKRAASDLPIGLALQNDISLKGPSGLPAAGGLLELQGFKGAWRKLGHPVDLSHDGRWYLSLLLKKVGTDWEGDPSYVLVTLTRENQSETIIGAGINEDDHLFALNSGANHISQVQMPTGKTQMLVIRLDSHQRFPDEIRAMIIPPQGQVDEEPDYWPVRSKGIHGNEKLDHLLIRNGRGAIFELDEIRIGKTWASVTQPRLPL